MRAVELLDRVRKAGHFKDPAHLRLLVSDKDLDPLRTRDDFQLLISDLLFPADVFARE